MRRPLSIMTGAIVLLLLAACAPGTNPIEWGLSLLRGQPVASSVVVCPDLDNPPESVIATLDDLGSRDPDAEAWLIDLSQALDQQDACRAR